MLYLLYQSTYPIPVSCTLHVFTKIDLVLDMEVMVEQTERISRVEMHMVLFLLLITLEAVEGIVLRY